MTIHSWTVSERNEKKYYVIAEIKKKMFSTKFSFQCKFCYLNTQQVVSMVYKNTKELYMKDLNVWQQKNTRIKNGHEKKGITKS